MAPPLHPVLHNQLEYTAMKAHLFSLLALAAVLPLSSCASGRSATRGTAVGAVAGAVVAGPVGLVAGGAVGNAMGDETDRQRRRSHRH